jgi:hypothetical protein
MGRNKAVFSVGVKFEATHQWRFCLSVSQGPDHAGRIFTSVFVGMVMAKQTHHGRHHTN